MDWLWKRANMVLRKKSENSGYSHAILTKHRTVGDILDNYYRWSQKRNINFAPIQRFQWETFMCQLCYSVFKYSILEGSSVSLAFGKEPAYLHFDNSKMRSYLLNCLHSGVLTEFPCKPEQRKNLYRPTLCCYTASCRMPERGLILQCTKCQRWFHPNCQEIKMNARQDCKMSRMQIKMIEVNAMACF